MPNKAIFRWSVTLVAIASVAAACGDAGSPTAARATVPSLEHVAYADTFHFGALKRNGSHSGVTVTATIDPRKESVVEIPSAGFTLWIPKGAIKGGKKLDITIRAIPGDVVAYEFLPHGIVFERQLIGIQSLRGTKVDSDSAQILDLGAGYFGDAQLAIDPLTGIGQVYEMQQAAASPKNNAFYFAIPHFSGYMIATGCCRQSTQAF
jgi:hypothetical protein